ncbi:hypothetical protein EVAR_48847_1 [Eumeta japonica]|uniref:Uncharacterized protein n=1 Tax=Eumeta variegata TaxID=151549 RepID=A0A4C1YBX8_EUMVA|nr:hypothetical protein EVAR_48847_1 [Eumeta japonica]
MPLSGLSQGGEPKALVSQSEIKDNWEIASHLLILRRNEIHNKLLDLSGHSLLKVRYLPRHCRKDLFVGEYWQDSRAKRAIRKKMVTAAREHSQFHRSHQSTDLYLNPPTLDNASRRLSTTAVTGANDNIRDRQPNVLSEAQKECFKLA